MIYFDTNILIYAAINQDITKLIKSQNLIKKSIKENKFRISVLNLQEFVYALSKLQVGNKIINDYFNYYNKFCDIYIEKSMIEKAVKLCNEIKSFNSINDAIHLSLAETYSSKLVTFDKDFKKFKDYSEIEIEVL